MITPPRSSGRHIEGRHRYRGTGGERPPGIPRSWQGINLVVSIMRIPPQDVARTPPESAHWPGASYLKEPVAHKLGVTNQSRSQLARRTVHLAAEQLPARRIHVVADGGFATGAFFTPTPPESRGHLTVVAHRQALRARAQQGPQKCSRGARRKGPPDRLSQRPWHRAQAAGNRIRRKPVPWCKAGWGFGTASCPVVSSVWCW